MSTSLQLNLLALVLVGALVPLACSSAGKSEGSRQGYATPERAIRAGVDAMIEMDARALHRALPPQSERKEADEFVANLEREAMQQVGGVTITNVQLNADETLATARVRIHSERGDLLTTVRMGAIRVDERWYFGGAIPDRD